MPIYAYRCTKCGEEEEHIQKVADPPRKRCGTCGGKLEKLMTSAAFQLKGGGWYADGYASKKSDASSDGAKSGDGTSGKPDAAQGSEAASSSKSGEGKKKTKKPKKTASGGD